MVDILLTKCDPPANEARRLVIRTLQDKYKQLLTFHFNTIHTKSCKELVVEAGYLHLYAVLR